MYHGIVFTHSDEIPRHLRQLTISSSVRTLLGTHGHYRQLPTPKIDVLLPCGYLTHVGRGFFFQKGTGNAWMH